MPSGLSIISDITTAIDDSAQKIMNFNLAAYQLKQDRELFDLDKKKKKIELDILERSASPEQADLERRKFKAEVGKVETELDISEHQLKVDRAKEFERSQWTLESRLEQLLTEEERYKTTPDAMADGKIDITERQPLSVAEKIEKLHQKGYESEFGPGGETFKRKQEEISDKPLQEELLKYQKAAADEGWDLDINPNLPLDQQLKKARADYAAKKGTKELSPTYTQKQEIEAVRSMLKRGKTKRGFVDEKGNSFEEYAPIETMEEVYELIEKSEKDPMLYIEEIKELEEKLEAKEAKLKGVAPLEIALTSWGKLFGLHWGDRATVDYAKNIKTMDDLLDFLDNMDELRKKGIDVDAIEEYYKKAGILE